MAVSLPAPRDRSRLGSAGTRRTKAREPSRYTCQFRINGASTLALTTNQGLAVCSDGANWQIGSSGYVPWMYSTAVILLVYTTSCQVDFGITTNSHFTFIDTVGLGSYLQLFSNSGGIQLGQYNDITITRVAAASLGLNGTYSSSGTKPTLTTGSCSGSTPVGGASVGSFTAATCAAGTYILSGMPATLNGYACEAQDETTPADTLKQTAHSTTSVTFTATTAASDNIVFKCMGF